MANTEAFKYNYSAKENEEVLKIRSKYIPQEESKLDELKRLDRKVQNSGIAEALCTGVIGSLLFGLGFCFRMGIIGSGKLLVMIGILFCALGIIGMASAYFVYRCVFSKTKARLTSRILELTDELSNEKKS